ncbi:MAG: 3-methyl-2-oxobutanoate hydroxymethyltransferase [Verrucomicrobiota bacterium]
MPKTKELMTCDKVRHWSSENPILALTAYDYPMARILDEAGTDILHVGDSLGMVIMGDEDTTQVTMEQMCYHTKAVSKARQRALITADLPYGSYDTPRDAVRCAKKLLEAGADAVKLEGGDEIKEQIIALRSEGIEIQGHLGLLPQRIKEEGRYRRKGVTSEQVEQMKRDAELLVQLGVFSIVLEAVVHEVANEITSLISVPTIGIGSGSQTTGQIHVIHDVLGLFPWFVPPFVKQEAKLADEIFKAIDRLKKSL